MSSDDIEVTLNGLTKQIEILKENNDAIFLISSGMFVFLMQCGFAFLEAGSVRQKNTINILLKNIMDIFIGSLSFWAVGYGFAYGKPGNAFIGHNHFFSLNVNYLSSETRMNQTNDADSAWTSQSYFAQWFFQFVFAATSATIVSGAMAERAGFTCYLVYSFTITGFIYPLVAHWVWAEEGWLKTGGGTGVFMQDEAGSAVVHLTGGVAALVGAKFLGPRLNRFKDGQVNPIPGHSLPLAALGAFILFVGFLSFNGSSVQRVSEKGDGAQVALAVMNTMLSGSAGGIIAITSERLYNSYKGKGTYWSILLAINGGLAGMVASSAGCNDVEPWAAVLTGSIAGVIFMVAKRTTLNLKIDDPLDAIPLHMGGGLIGTILAPVFAIRGQYIDGKPVGGIVYSWHRRAFMGLGWNVFGCVIIILWTGACSFLMFYALYRTGTIRISDKIEEIGIDLCKHGENAYPEDFRVEVMKEITNEKNENQLPQAPEKRNQPLPAIAIPWTVTECNDSKVSASKDNK